MIRPIVSLLFFQGLFAQPDTLYIQTFPDKITVRTGLQITANNFMLKDPESNTFIDLEPIKRDYFGLSVLFRSLEIDAGYSPGFFSDKQDLDGAGFFTLNFRMFLGKWMQTLDFYNQKGFNASQNELIAYLPDIRTTKIGGSTSLIFNNRYSFRAIGFQNERQKKSAGSFIPRFTFYYTKFKWRIDDFRSLSDSYDMTIGPGYYYNFIFGRNFIVAAGASAGIGLNVTAYENKTFKSVLYQTGFRGAIGYNSERFFTGINTSALLLEHDEDETTRFDDTISFLEFYIGYRFDAPKRLMQLADTINAKIQ